MNIQSFLNQVMVSLIVIAVFTFLITECTTKSAPKEVKTRNTTPMSYNYITTDTGLECVTIRKSNNRILVLGVSCNWEKYNRYL